MLANTSAFSSVLVALAAISSVNAHGALVAISGSNGVNGQGFGIVDSTPRDGTKRQPFQTDTSIIRDREIESGAAGACGRTLAGGVNDMTAQLEAASSAGLPAADADGTVKMTIHQINGDGAGPYTCGVSADASGQNFVDMQVTTNVPGQNSRSKAKATDFPLVAQMPAGTTCTGGPNGDACIVRCRNAARAGPFGGCAAVTNASGGATNGTTTPAPAKGGAKEGGANEDVNKGGANQGGAKKGGANQGGANEGGAKKGGAKKGANEGANEGGANQGAGKESPAKQGGANEGGAKQGGANKGGANKGNANKGNANQGDANQANQGDANEGAAEQGTQQGSAKQGGVKNARAQDEEDEEDGDDQVLARRAFNTVKPFDKKRVVRSRIAGAKAGYWI